MAVELSPKTRLTANAVLRETPLLIEVLRRACLIVPHLVRVALLEAEEERKNMALGVQRKALTLAVGQTTLEIELGWRAVFAIVTDANLTGTALTFFREEMEGGVAVWRQIYDNNTARSRTVATSRALQEDPNNWLGIWKLRIVSGTTQATADSVLTIVYGDYPA